MALLKCPDCGNDVSDQATACPSCGRPVQAAEPEKRIRRRTWGLQEQLRRIQEDPKDSRLEKIGCRYPLLLLVLLPIVVLLFLLLR